MAFERRTSPEGVVWLRSALLASEGIPHGFSTRLGGESLAPFDSLNMGLADAPGEPDAWDRVERNWARLLRATGLEGRELVRLRQVHGSVVRDADLEMDVARSAPPFADGDAIVTADAAQVVSVRIADCGPVLLADPTAGLVAAVHAGWRGLCACIVERAVDHMLARGAQIRRVVVAIGPCIGPAAFEVGDDVRAAMEVVGLGQCVEPGPGGVRWRADLPGAIRAQLVRRGVRDDRIDLDDRCTASTGDLFSYRREGPRSGRMAALIGL
ncbi:MAG: peptidoglycan editing factor PgeF [Planctomycetes bacterium]|nr:peptidoglycan editing factor PgeF [Planctomycetota bacterium]